MAKTHTGGGSGGASGYGFQASATALAGVHLLTKKALGWIGVEDVPVGVSAETGGPGDDIEVELQAGLRIFVQVKLGLHAGDAFFTAMADLCAGLEDDPSAHGVLLVDSGASRAIQRDLGRELQRLGEGRADHPKKITRKLIISLQRRGHLLSAVASRLHVVMRDLSANSSATASALEDLAGVQDRDARGAWKVLQNAALELIQRRGRWTRTEVVSVLGQAGFGLVGDRGPDKGLLSHYRVWVQKSNATFRVPGLDVARSIQGTHFQLDVFSPGGLGSPTGQGSLDAAIKSYREWGGRKRSLWEPGIRPEDAVALHERFVIVGGPGSGKTTLSQRLAYDLTRAGKTVIRVRLRDISRAPTIGFQDAVLSFATDGSGLSGKLRGEALSDPHHLIADGLDECGSQRARIAESLTTWAAGHPDCRIVVTTRAVGHDESLLPGWPHFELLPLGKRDAVECARFLLGDAEGSAWDVPRVLQAFETHIEESSFVELAARSPLLIGFLLTILVSGEEVGRSRGELYRRILRLVHRRDRSSRPVEDALSEVHSQRSLLVFGWLLQSNPNLYFEEFLERAGSWLGPLLDTTPARASVLAEQAFVFWEQRGILEAVSHADFQVPAFVLLPIQEYAAGRFLSDLPDDEFAEAVRARQRSPSWREALLLSASQDPRRLVDVLLSFDDAEDLTSQAAVLAAAALGEATDVLPEISLRVAEHLSKRLTSSFPLVAWESGAALVDYLSHEHRILGTLAQLLVGDDQPWTNAIGITLSAVAGGKYVDYSVLEEHYEDLDTLFHPERQGRIHIMIPMGPDSKLKAVLLIRATELLCSDRPGPGTQRRVARLLAAGRMNLATSEKVRAIARRHGIEPELTPLEKAMLEVTASFGSIPKPRDSERVIIRSVVLAFPGEKPLVQPSQLTELAALFETLRIPECPVPDYFDLAKDADEEVLQAVIRGAASAAGLHPARLQADAVWAEHRIEANSDEALLSILPRISPQVDWSRTAVLDLEPALLARALGHSCVFVVQAAAELIQASPRAQEVGAYVRLHLNEFSKYGHTAAASLADRLWGKEAASVLLARVEGELSRDCEALLCRLPDLADESELPRVQEALVRALHSKRERIVAGAAEGLGKLPKNDVISLELRGAFKAWGTLERPYPTQGGVVPFSPRNDIFLAGEIHGSHSAEELKCLCSDARVGESAKKALVARARTSRELLVDLLASIARAPELAQLLPLLANDFGEQIAEERDAYDGLLESMHREVRLAATHALTTLALPKVEARTRAETMLRDEDPQVRDAGVRALRSLDAKNR